MVRSDLGDVIPESVAHKALRLPAEEPKSIMLESDIVPSLPATSIVQEKAKKVLTLRIDPNRRKASCYARSGDAGKMRNTRDG